MVNLKKCVITLVLPLSLLAGACLPGGSAFAATTLTPIVTSTPAANYTVSGVVTDNSGNPISGAVLAVNGENYATTASDGSYSLSLPDGSYTLAVSASGYQTATFNLNVADTNLTGQNITLTPGTSNNVLDNSDTWNQVLTTGRLNGKPVTRAMFMAMLVNRLHLKKEANINFIDVPGNAWYVHSLKLAVGAGLMHGVGANKFAPNQIITLKQMQALVNSAKKIDPQFNGGSYARLFNGPMMRTGRY